MASAKSSPSIVPQFITGDFVQRRVFLEDREYGLALDALVKACSDILCVSSRGDKVLLGRRKVEPQPDWWYIGGRARPGDTTRSAAARNVKRELGLDLDESRYNVIATYSMVWQMRQQEPATNGTADISTVHELRLTEEEEKSITLDPEEYSDSNFFSFDDVLMGDFHPCLKQAIRDLRKLRAEKALIEATRSHADSSYGERKGTDMIIAAALAFEKASEAAAVEKEVTKVRFIDQEYEYVGGENGYRDHKRTSSLLSEEMEGGAA